MAAKYPTVTVYSIPARYGAGSQPLEWRWRFLAANSRNTGNGSVGYRDLHHCLNGAATTLYLPHLELVGMKPGDVKVVRRGKEFVRIIIACDCGSERPDRWHFDGCEVAA